MRDPIERQAAQTELMMKCERYTLARESHGMGYVEWSSDLISVADAMDVIRDLPSAQPETEERTAESVQNVSDSDLISRKAAIEAIDAVLPVDPMKSVHAQGIALGAELAKTYVEQLPSAQPAQRWIPCSERLPEKAYGQYWVCTDTGYQCQCRWTDNVYGLGSSGEWTWKIFDIPQYSHVVAWMPLPEPYKERREE